MSNLQIRFIDGNFFTLAPRLKAHHVLASPTLNDERAIVMHAMR